MLFAFMDLILTNKEGFIGVAKVEDSLGCRDHEVMDFRILRGGSRANRKVTILDFRRAILATS